MERRKFAQCLGLAVLALGAGATGGCLLYTDTFNAPPRVRIDSDVAEAWRGQRASFNAVVTGDDAVAFKWRVGKICPASASDAAGEVAAETPRFAFSSDVAGRYCVSVVVVDAVGAPALATKEIDVKSRALVVEAPAEVAYLKPALFTARFADDDAAAGKASFAWARDPDCAKAVASARMQPRERGKSTWQIEHAPKRAFCVGVVAIDEFGVETTGEHAIPNVTITGKAAAIRMITPTGAKAPFGLFTQFRLSGAAPDEAPLPGTTFSWSITAPSGQKSGRVPCADPMPLESETCFAAESAGRYLVELTVTENETPIVTDPLELVAEDAPPCIRETEPSFVTAPKVTNSYDQERVFRVARVEDDADPWPLGPRAQQGEFIWAVRKQGVEPDFSIRVGANLDRLTLPAREYSAGDIVEVRVRYLDRQAVASPAARSLAHCGRDDARCELPAGAVPACYQWITWTVSYQ